MAKTKKRAVEKAALPVEDQATKVKGTPEAPEAPEKPKTSKSKSKAHEVVFEFIGGGSFTSRAMGISVLKGDVFTTSDPAIIERLRGSGLFAER